jgi:hypothetical protein
MFLLTGFGVGGGKGTDDKEERLLDVASPPRNESRRKKK